MAVEEYEGQKFLAQACDLVQDWIAVEEALQITINNKPFSVTMRTPGEDTALVRGLLYAEDVYRGAEDLKIDFRKKNAITQIANVQLKKEQLGTGFNNSRTLLSVSSCGICGKQELNDESTFKACLTDHRTISIQQLYQLFETMREQQDDFLRAGGSHAAAAFSTAGELLCLMEDIGRHNAVDKVVGALLGQQQLPQAVGLLVSGRISYEIVAKAYSANIPILAAVSAPSSLAIQYAKQFGLTLLGFCRGEKATCYANPQRIDY